MRVGIELEEAILDPAPIWRLSKRPQQSIPQGEEIGKIRIGQSRITRVMDVVHVWRDQEDSGKPIESLGPIDVRVLDVQDREEHRIEQDHGVELDPEQQHGD